MATLESKVGQFRLRIEQESYSLYLLGGPCEVLLFSYPTTPGSFGEIYLDGIVDECYEKIGSLHPRWQWDFDRVMDAMMIDLSAEQLIANTLDDVPA